MPASRLLRAALALLLLCSCTTARSARPGDGAARTLAPPRWLSPLHAQHPLVGTLWDVQRGRPADEAQLRSALADARYVLLGERHDNADHHLLQAALVQALAQGERRPALAFEMLDVGEQSRVDAALARAPRDADALALAVDWAHSGWPDWSLYRPVFAAGLERGLPVVAANLPREQLRGLVHGDPQALDAQTRARLGLTRPLPHGVAHAMREEMRASHCGHLPEPMLEPMALAQRARDAHLADRMLAADTGDGAILIAGAGHVRNDRGTPTYLAQREPGRQVLSVGFVEVSPDALQPQAYAAAFDAERLPFDYVWFTPATAREDPCAAFQKR
jgi:uncharacterized iron-regulated protein